jgi:hypothetical protein
MAVITPSAVISEIRGKAGNLVFSKNQYRPYVKGFSVPANPNTARQISSRSSLETGVVEWQGFSDDERRKWNLEAKRWSSRLSLSGSRPLNGFNLYLRRWMMADKNTLGLLINSASPRKMASAYLGVPTCTTTVFTVPVIVTNSPTGFYWIIRITPPQSPGVMSVNQSRLVWATNGENNAGNVTVDLKAIWEALFATTLATHTGKAIFISINPVDGLSQFQGIRQIVKAII